MVKISANQIAKELNKRERKARSKAMEKWKKLAKPLVKSEIKKRIAKGISPVSKQPNYQKYSESYKKTRKRFGKGVRPVDLNLTGKMMKSLSAKSIKDGISIFFTSAIAKYHNGKGRVRRATLPIDSQGESFKNGIKKNLRNLFIKVFKIK